MIIKEIELSNFCQHTSRKLEFGHVSGNDWKPHSHVGIIGQNGSGKSNILHSFEYAIVGDLANFKKEDLLSWGEEKGYVKLTFLHDGKEGVIKRSIQGASASFKYAGVSVSGITKVNNAIAENIGMTKDICRNGVFVHQADIDGILFDTQANREKKWQHLVGMHDMSKIHTGMGKFLSALPAPQDYQGQKNLLDEQELPWLERKKTEDKLLTIDTESITKELVRISCVMAALRNNNKTKERIEVMTKCVQTAEERKVVIQKTADEVSYATRDNVAKLHEEIAKDEQLLRDASNHERMFAEYTTKTKNILKYKQKLTLQSSDLYDKMQEQSTITEEAYIEESKKVNEATITARTTTAIIKALEEAPSGCDCPVCNQKIAGDTKTLLLPELRNRLASALTRQKKGQQVTHAYETWGIYNLQEVTKMRQEVQTTKQNIATAQAAIDTIPEEMRTQRVTDTAGLNARIAKNNEELSTTEFRARAYDNAQSSLRLAISEVARTKAALAEAKLTETATITTQTEEELTEQYNKLEARRVQGLAEAREAEQTNSALQAIQDQRDRIKVKETKDAERREFLAFMTRVRDWFHYSNGPHKVSVEVLRQLTPGVNKFLGMFNSDYSVETDYNTLSYRVLFHDNRPTPADGPPMASVLSGGQRIMLALAFRMACYYMFASKFGIMTLDEPTVYLDDTNVNNFVGLFETLHSLSEKLGIQMFISTHERALIPVMDHFVDL